MNANVLRVWWFGRETVRVEIGDLTSEVLCYFDGERKAFTAILSDQGTRNGKPCQLSPLELVQVENSLRAELGIRKLFGFAIGKRELYIQRAQHVS